MVSWASVDGVFPSRCPLIAKDSIVRLRVMDIDHRRGRHRRERIEWAVLRIRPSIVVAWDHGVDELANLLALECAGRSLSRRSVPLQFGTGVKSRAANGPILNPVNSRIALIYADWFRCLFRRRTQNESWLQAMNGRELGRGLEVLSARASEAVCSMNSIASSLQGDSLHAPHALLVGTSYDRERPDLYFFEPKERSPELGWSSDSLQSPAERRHAARSCVVRAYDSATCRDVRAERADACIVAGSHEGAWGQCGKTR